VTDLPSLIVDALRNVYDPCCAEKGISVVDMGLVRSVEVDEDGARVELILTSGWCPFAVDLISTVQERVGEVAGIENATVKVRWDEAWGPELMAPGARAKLRFLPPPRSVADRDAYVEARTAPPSGEGRS